MSERARESRKSRPLSVLATFAMWAVLVAIVYEGHSQIRSGDISAKPAPQAGTSEAAAVAWPRQLIGAVRFIHGVTKPMGATTQPADEPEEGAVDRSDSSPRQDPKDDLALARPGLLSNQPN